MIESCAKVDGILYSLTRIEFYDAMQSVSGLQNKEGNSAYFCESCE